MELLWPSGNHERPGRGATQERVERKREREVYRKAVERRGSGREMGRKRTWTIV